MLLTYVFFGLITCVVIMGVWYIFGGFDLTVEERIVVVLASLIWPLTWALGLISVVLFCCLWLNAKLNGREFP